MNDTSSEQSHVNEVHVVGRLAVAPVSREMPSGDMLVSFRLVVARASTRKVAGVRTPSVDTLDCSVWRADVRRRLGTLQPGDVVEVYGALRRRFWRQGVMAMSRSEIEVSKLRRLTSAA